MKLLLKICYIVVSLILLVLGAGQFFSNTPPAGVIGTVLRLPYQALVQWMLPLTIALMVLLIVLLCFKKMPISVGAGFAFLVLAGSVYLDYSYMKNVEASEAEMTNFSYAENLELEEKDQTYVRIDEHETAGLSQLSVYIPSDNTAKVCLIHINYDNWSQADKNKGMYLKKICEERGYAFVQLAGTGKEDGTITDIVKRIRWGIAYVQMKYKFEKTFLAGSASGGHLALVCAYADAYSNDYGEHKTPVDGVIAISAPVDLAYQRKYFVKDYAAEDVLGNMGDMLYCTMFHGTAGTIGGEVAKLQEQFLGTYSDENKLYQISAVKNLLKKKKIPILFIQGEKDSLLGSGDRTELCSLLEKKKIPYVSLDIFGTDHDYDQKFPEYTPAGKRTIKEIGKWLDTVVAPKKTKK